MRIAWFILGCLLYSVEGQFGNFFGGGKPGINAPLIGNIESPVDVPAVPGLGDLEKLFLQDWLDFGVRIRHGIKKYLSRSHILIFSFK